MAAVRTADAEPGAGAVGVLAPTVRATTAGIVIAITLFAFESLAVATALPTVARDLDGLASYGWAFTAFLLANVVGMVLGGGLSDRSGPRAPVLTGLAVFALGLVVAGTAGSMGILIAGRAVQGVAAGTVTTALYVLVGRTYPAPDQPRIIAAMSTAWVVPSLVGPVVAGAVVQHAGWRWVFLGMVPLVAVGLVLLVPALRGTGTRRSDRGPTSAPTSATGRLGGRLLTALAVAVGIGALQVAGQHLSLWSVPLAVAGLAVLVRALTRLLPPGAFRLPPGVGTAVVLRGLLTSAFFGVEALVPLSLQQQQGLTPALAGVPLTGAALSWAAGSWVVGRARPEVRARSRLIRVGFGCVVAAEVGMAAAAQPGTPVLVAFAAWLVAGLGAGLGISSQSVLLLRWTTDADRGRDSAAMQLTDAVGASLGIGLGGVLVAVAVAGVLSRGTAFAAVDLTLAAVAVPGLVLSGRLADPPTAAL